MNDKEKKAIVKIGFLGPSPEENVKERLSKHELFCHQEVKVIKKEYASELKDGLDQGEFDYAIVPCRNDQNEINLVMMDMISSMVSRGYVEIGSYYEKQNFNRKVRRVQDEEYVDLQANYAFGQSEYQFSDDGKMNEYLEYKIFQKSTYRPSFFDRAFIFLFADGLLSKILGSLLVIGAFAFIILGFIVSKDILDKITLWVSLSTACFQFIIYILDLKEKARMRLIRGYWIYYSFEERKSSSSFVPKGFKTRIMTIDQFDDEINISCKVEGEDNIFFSTNNVNFEYSPRTRMGKGFYEYVTNVRNNMGKRAEGVCRYQGKREKNSPFTSMDGWFSSRGTEITGRVKYVRVSKEEYETLQKSNGYYANQFENDHLLLVGVYGDECSNTDLVAKRYIQEHRESFQKEISYVYFESIQAMYDSFKNHKIDFAVVPERNRGNPIIGHQKFVENFSSSKVDEIHFPVKYLLASVYENYRLDENTIFIGHQQSIEQCASFIQNRKTERMSSSSHAARELKFFAHPERYVAICNADAQRYYHLFPVKDENGKVIDPYIDSIENITIFSIYRNKITKKT